MRAILEKDFPIHLNVAVKTEESPGGVKVSWTGAATGEHIYEKLLVATGRAPRFDDLCIDDSHLDFRLSILRQVGPSGPMLIATTAVRTHNRLGRLFLRVIHPFHIFIVLAAVTRAAARS